MTSNIQKCSNPGEAFLKYDDNNVDREVPRGKNHTVLVYCCSNYEGEIFNFNLCLTGEYACQHIFVANRSPLKKKSKLRSIDKSLEKEAKLS